MDCYDPYELLNSLLGPVRDDALPPLEKWPDYSHLKPITFTSSRLITSRVLASVNLNQPAEQIDPDPCTISFVSPASQKLCAAV